MRHHFFASMRKERLILLSSRRLSHKVGQFGPPTGCCQLDPLCIIGIGLLSHKETLTYGNGVDTKLCHFMKNEGHLL